MRNMNMVRRGASMAACIRAKFIQILKYKLLSWKAWLQSFYLLLQATFVNGKAALRPEVHSS